MTTPDPLVMTVHYKPRKWLTVLVANGVLTVVGAVLVMLGVLQFSAWGWKAIGVVGVGLLAFAMGLGNALGAKRRFAPTDLVAAGVESRGFILPSVGLLPWPRISGIEFVYTLGTGAQRFLDLAYGMDQRRVVIRLDTEALSPEQDAAILQQSPDAHKEGVQTAYVTGLVGGTDAFIDLLVAAERAVPADFPLTVTSKDSWFLGKVEKARASA